MWKPDNKRELESAQAVIKKTNEGSGITKGTLSAWPEKKFLYNRIPSLFSKWFVLPTVEAANKPYEYITMFFLYQAKITILYVLSTWFKYV